MAFPRLARLSRALVIALSLSVGIAVPATSLAAVNPSKTVQKKSSKTKVSQAKNRVVKKTQKHAAKKAPKRVVAKKLTGKKSMAKAKHAKAPVLAAVEPTVGEQLGLNKIDDPLNLSSNAVLVLDQETKEVLLGKNEKAVLPIASITKLMTGLLVTEANLPMDETITITSDDVDRLKHSSSRLSVGTQLKRSEALHLALMSSENRAAHALGRTYPGGLPAFVAKMNEKARELGMQDTGFVDPTGLSSDNRSSARDLAKLVSAAYKKPILRELSTSPEYEVDAGRRTLQYRNSNRLVRDDNWDIGLQKTGYIREAGRCLVMQVKVSGRKLIMVLLDAAGPAARIGDAKRLRRWAEVSLKSGSHPQAAL